jgi:hypothetical protein
MQPLKAHVRNGRLLLDESTDLPDGDVVYLQFVDGVVSIDDDDDGLDTEERAKLHRELEASFAEADAGQAEDLTDAFADDDNELDDEERAALDRVLEASFVAEEAGQLIDAADVIADLRSTRQIGSRRCATSAAHQDVAADESARG